MADALLNELDRIVGPHARRGFIEEAVIRKLLLRASADEADDVRAHDARDRVQTPTGEVDELAALTTDSVKTA